MTHWVAFREGHVFDINAGEWTTWDEWKEFHAPRLVQKRRNATGWRIKCTYAINHEDVDIHSAFPGCEYGWIAPQ